MTLQNRIVRSLIRMARKQLSVLTMVNSEMKVVGTMTDLSLLEKSYEIIL